MWLTFPRPLPAQGFGGRKKRKALDMDERVLRDKDGKIAYSASKGGKGKRSAASTSGGKVKASAPQAGPSQPAAKKAKR